MLAALQDSGVRVEAEQCTFVGKWVELARASDDGLARRAQHAADFLRLEQARQVCACHLGLRQVEALFLQGGGLPCAE